MGNYLNKLIPHIDESRKGSEIQTAAVAVRQQQHLVIQEMSTPTRFEKKILTDPRSISSGIQRTPILADYTPVGVNKRTLKISKEHIETSVDVAMPPMSSKKQFIETSTDDIQVLKSDSNISNYLTPNINVVKDLKNMTAIERARYKVLGLDPRSPAADFSRTPILAPKSLAMIKLRSQQRLQRKGSYETDMFKPRDSYQTETVTTNIPEVFSEGLKKILKSTKQHVLVDLNLTDTPRSTSDSSLFDSEEDVMIVKNLNFKDVQRSVKKSIIVNDPTNVLSNEVEEDTDKLDDFKDVVEQNKKIVRIEDDNKIKVWHDSLMTVENVSDEDDRNGEKVNEELPQDVTFEESVTKDMLLSETIKTEVDNQKKKNKGKNVKKISKSGRRLKVDEKRVFSPDNKYDNEKQKNRTPLGNRSNNGQTQDTPTKSPQQLLKSKTVAIKTYQENTPPYKGCAVRTRNRIRIQQLSCN